LICYQYYRITFSPEVHYYSTSLYLKINNATNLNIVLHVVAQPGDAWSSDLDSVNRMILTRMLQRSEKVKERSEGEAD